MRSIDGICHPHTVAMAQRIRSRFERLPAFLHEIENKKSMPSVSASDMRRDENARETSAKSIGDRSAATLRPWGPVLSPRLGKGRDLLRKRSEGSSPGKMERSRWRIQASLRSGKLSGQNRNAVRHFPEPCPNQIGIGARFDRNAHQSTTIQAGPWCGRIPPSRTSASMHAMTKRWSVYHWRRSNAERFKIIHSLE